MYLTAALITSLPFFAFGLIVILTRERPGLSAGLSLGASACSLAGALGLLIFYRDAQGPVVYSSQWFVTGDISITFGFLLDPAGLLMLLLVALISLLVQVYSLGYMAGDPGFSRYYAFQSLFSWAMMSLTVSASLVQLYVFWELVGLCSYFLIGFWYERFSATEAGKKAFVMTRLGDAAFFAGVLILLLNLGTLDIREINDPGLPDRLSPGLITLGALLIFGGIAGKSAQFPLMTWLPDAMEGPTPVSALLHSATMVAAGVFLLARLFPFFSHSGTAMAVFLWVGTATMLMAATMAVVERDIKRIWAYSTISQLGLMIMGLAAGGYFAGLFHLASHAFFKALLFLCCGVWIHAYGTNDVFEIGKRGAGRFTVAAVCLVIAASGLAGLPPLSGYFSKEAVLQSLLGHSNPGWFAAGLAGAFLTSYYAFRTVFLVLSPPPADKFALPSAGAPHAGPGVGMTWPLIILAALTATQGLVQAPLESFLTGGVYVTGHYGWLPYATTGIAAAGILGAWYEFGRKRAGRIGFAEKVPPLRIFFEQRWYLDRLYGLFSEKVVYGTFVRLSSFNESRIIDGGIDRFCGATLAWARVLSRLQSGVLRYNLMIPFVVVILAAVYALVRS